MGPWSAGPKRSGSRTVARQLVVFGDRGRRVARVSAMKAAIW